MCVGLVFMFVCGVSVYVCVCVVLVFMFVCGVSVYVCVCVCVCGAEKINKNRKIVRLVRQEGIKCMYE